MASSPFPSTELSVTTIINGTIPASGTSSWTSKQHSIDVSNYKRVVLSCRIASAGIGNSLEIDTVAINSQNVSAYWDASNLCNIQISESTLFANAKTKDYPISYQLLGLS